jgi:hypothetical protein
VLAVDTTFTADSLHADSFLFALNLRLGEAPPEAVDDAYHGAAAWTRFVFSALAAAAEDCGMVSCAAHHATTSSRAGAWAQREHLFDVTWFRRACADWETPALILEHEDAWDQDAFMVDFWKLLLGYAPVRVIIGYSRHARDHEAWIARVNAILAEHRAAIRLPEHVEDLILLGHRGMPPTGYAVYRRRERRFELAADSLSSVLMPDPADHASWDTYIRRMEIATGERVRQEVDRLQRANIIDKDGRLLIKTTPPDMDPSSGTSTITG